MLVVHTCGVNGALKLHDGKVIGEANSSPRSRALAPKSPQIVAQNESWTKTGGGFEMGIEVLQCHRGKAVAARSAFHE